MNTQSQCSLDVTVPLRQLTSLVALGCLCAISLACSSSSSPSSAASTSGAPGVGGRSQVTGGTSSSSATGGSTAIGGQAGAAQGGSLASGGADVTGGAGANAGGSSSPGSGGAATGGTAPAGTGGLLTGGASATTGGAATGGSAATTGGAATGGAATGGAGTGGAGTGGTSSSPVTPTLVSSTDYRFTLGNVILDINPQVGGRVVSLTLSGANVISPYTCASYDPNNACNNSGATFWTSPQSGWDGVVGGTNVWPPVAAIDGNPYTASISANHLILTGTVDATLGASVTKDFSADSATGWISITYTIKATKTIQVAPWQITRVPRGGLVLFPLVSLVSNTTSPLWVLSPANGFEWIDDSTQTSITSAGPKVIADGGVSGQNYTWIAYALSGRLLLIKYPDVLSSAFAPGEGDTEVYPGSGYMELESQGAYNTSLAANATLAWTVQWRVVAIPSTVTVANGNSTLSDFAQQQAAL